MSKHFNLTPEQRADAQRLGTFCTHIEQHIFHLMDEDAEFAEILTGALIAEFTGVADGTYPPLGHSFPRVEH